MVCIAHTCVFSAVLSFVGATHNFCSFQSELQGLDSYNASSDIYNSLNYKCECDRNKYVCVRKCCAENYIFNRFDNTCRYNDTEKIKVSVFKYRTVLSDTPSNISFVYGWNHCEFNQSSNYFPVVNPLVYIQEDGRLWMAGFDKYFNFDHYCLDYFEETGLAAYACLYRREVDSFMLSQKLTTIGKMISLPFLLATFLTYAILPLRNFHGKSLMSYVFALFVAYCSYTSYFIYVENVDDVPLTACKEVAVLYLYFFLASFFWMNVMCIDIFKTFSGSHGFSNITRLPKHNRFMHYSFYAWGSPFLFGVAIWLIYKNASPNTWYHPGFVGTYCWLNDGIPTLLYFYLPKAVLIIANITLFVATTCKIRQIQQDTAVLRQDENRRSRNERDRQRFKIYLKLFLVMGINWAMEVIAWLINWQVENVPRTVWYVTDFCNAAFGVFIFFIFVFKKRIWKLIKKKFSRRKKGNKRLTKFTTIPSISAKNCVTYV